VQRENLKFTRVSRSQVLAYCTSKGMKGAAEKLAAKLEEHLPGNLARHLKDALQQSKARPVEHGVLRVVLSTKELFWSCGQTRSAFCAVLAQTQILA